MKKLFIILTIVVVAGCSKDDPTPSVVGQWFVADEHFSAKVGDQSLVDYLVADGIPESDAKTISTSQLKNFTVTDVGFIYQFTADGYYGKMITPTDKFNAQGKWTLSDDGKTLSITAIGGNGSNTITKLTNSELEFYRPQGTRAMNGYTITYYITVLFKRVKA